MGHAAEGSDAEEQKEPSVSLTSSPGSYWDCLETLPQPSKGYFSLKQNKKTKTKGCVTEVSVALGCFDCPQCRAALAGRSSYLFFPRAASTSSSGFSECHWAMGRRGLASMSDQCRSSVPVALQPVKILPMASFFPSLS